MAKKRKILQTTKSEELKVTHPDTAGVDVGKDVMQVSVPRDRSTNSNRCFGTFTKDLNDIRGWLIECGIKRVVMESTGIYWIPLFLQLQEAGMEVILVNARETKNIAGRKTDVADADWLRFLGSCNLIKPCYQPEAISRRLRIYSRQRTLKTKQMSVEIQHMQKSLEQMNLKLAGVISDIVGKSGRLIITAILGGKRDPGELASLADPRCRKSKREIALALEGTWDPEHLFSLQQAWDTYKFLEGQMSQCDKAMEEFLDSYEYTGADIKKRPFERSEKPICKKNRINFDIEQHAFQMFGTNLMKIPGASQSTLMVLMSELGPGFIKKFKTPGKFCRWCNLSPCDNITGGRVVSSYIPKRPNPVGQAFRQCAMTLQKSKTSLGMYFRRMNGRLGKAQAVVATAHKIAETVFLLVERLTEYNPEYRAMSEEEITKSVIERLKKRLEKLQNSQNIEGYESDQYAIVI